METCATKNNDTYLSTTGTLGSDKDNLKYMNINFEANSEASSQANDAFMVYRRLQNAPNKILPSRLALNAVDECKSEQELIALQEKSLSEMGYKANDVCGWEQIVQPSKDDLYKLLKNMIDNHIKPSVQIQIGQVTFNCHMMVLQCYSEFFMECNNEIHIQLPEEKVTPSAFIMVYDWMLSSQPLIQREGILELFNAANFLRIKELINQCWLCLDDDVRFREDTAFLLFLEARTFCMDNLEQLMLTRICKFFLTLVASKEFLMLNAKEICTLLSSNTIGVNSEIEIFMSAVRWLNHNWQERESHMLDVLKCVRFSLMPPWFLVTLKKNTDCIEIDRIIEHTEVKDMINDGITYTNIQLYYGENRHELLNLLERFQLVAPMQRQWIYDKECKYHHRLECPNMQNVNYRLFMEYLGMIRSNGKDYWRSLDMDKSTERPKQGFLCTDCRKTTEPNLVPISAKQSRDQGIQCPDGLKSPWSKDFNRTTLIHKNFRCKSSVRRSPRGHPKHLPLSASQTKKSMHNNTITEMAVTMDLKHVLETDIQQNFHATEKEQHPEDVILYVDNNYKQQQKQDQQPVVIEHGHLIHGYPLNNTDNVSMKSEQHQQVSNPYQINQQQELKHGESKQPLYEKSTDSSKSAMICKSIDGLMIDDTNGQQQPHHPISNTDDNTDVELMKQGQVICKAVSVCNVVNEEGLFDARPKLRPSTLVDHLLRISNYEIFLFGGIDPYRLHCQHMQQIQQAQQNKTPQQVLRLQKCHLQHQQQELPQRQCETHAHGQSQTYAANNNVELLGDHVLYYDIEAKEWRHLSNIPFGSRHHHAVVACNGLIYVVGGTRPAMDCIFAKRKLAFENSIWCFNPKTLKWIQETNLPESRRDFAAVAVENQNTFCDKVTADDEGFYVIGGEGVNGRALNTVWFYSIKQKIWLRKPPLTMGRYGLTATMVNNEIWIAGGIINYINSHGENKKDITDTIEIYDLKYAHCGLLTKKQPKVFSNSKCVDDAAGDYEGRGVGESKNCINANNFKNEPGATVGNAHYSEGQWIKSNLHLRIPRLFGKFCKMSNGQLYVVGGLNFNEQLKSLTSLMDIDVYNEKQQKWEHVGSLNLARHSHDVAILNDHCLVAIGGVSTFEQRALNNVEAFCTKTRKSLNDLPDLPWPISGCAVITLK